MMYGTTDTLANRLDHLLRAAQAEVRMIQKGTEAAQCAVEMANLLKAVK